MSQIPPAARPSARCEWSRSAQVCLAIVLAAGLNVVWGVGLTWAVAFLSTMTERSEPFVQVLLAADGTPVLSHGYRDGRSPEYTTLDGKPFPESDANRWLQGASLSIESPQAAWSLIRPVAPVMVGYTDGLRSPTDWFFVQFRKPERHGYFVGYDRVSQQRVGYLGRAGFQLQEPTAGQAFVIKRVSGPDWSAAGCIVPQGTEQGMTPEIYSYQVDSSEPLPGKIPGGVLYLVGGDGAFRIDLRARTVATVLEAPGLDQIAILSRMRERAPAAEKPMLELALAVREQGTVIVLDAKGRRETVYHLPAELSDRSLTFYQMADRTAVALVYRHDGKNRMKYQDLIWFTKEGTIVRRIDGALASKTWNMPLGSLALIVACAIPAPVAPIGTAFVDPLAADDVDDEPRPATYRAAVLSEIPALVPAVILAAIWTGLAIGLYYRRTAAYGERRQAAWIVMIALLGLPGYFGYVLARRWPVRVACPSCGDPAPRDREACFHCGAEFPLPAANRLEIFA